MAKFYLLRILVVSIYEILNIFLFVSELIRISLYWFVPLLFFVFGNGISLLLLKKNIFYIPSLENGHGCNGIKNTKKSLLKNILKILPPISILSIFIYFRLFGVLFWCLITYIIFNFMILFQSKRKFILNKLNSLDYKIENRIRSVSNKKIKNFFLNILNIKNIKTQKNRVHNKINLIIVMFLIIPLFILSLTALFPPVVNVSYPYTTSINDYNNKFMESSMLNYSIDFIAWSPGTVEKLNKTYGVLDILKSFNFHPVILFSFNDLNNHSYYYIELKKFINAGFSPIINLNIGDFIGISNIDQFKDFVIQFLKFYDNESLNIYGISFDIETPMVDFAEATSFFNNLKFIQGSISYIRTFIWGYDKKKYDYASSVIKWAILEFNQRGLKVFPTCFEVDLDDFVDNDNSLKILWRRPGIPHNFFNNINSDIKGYPCFMLYRNLHNIERKSFYIYDYGRTIDKFFGKNVNLLLGDMVSGIYTKNYKEIIKDIKIIKSFGFKSTGIYAFTSWFSCIDGFHEGLLDLINKSELIEIASAINGSDTNISDLISSENVYHLQLDVVSLIYRHVLMVMDIIIDFIFPPI
ncbi:MAG: hypothetical protein ACTSRZ_04565 [Promethearchaeota archaeon]